MLFYVECAIFKFMINKTRITRKQEWEEKQLYEYFKQKTEEISHEKTWIWIRKRNFNSENWISSNSSTKQLHKDQLCWRENRLDATEEKV